MRNAVTILTDVDQANAIELPVPQGPRHHPIKYGDVMETLTDELYRAGWDITSQKWELDRPMTDPRSGRGLVGTCLTGRLTINNGMAMGTNGEHSYMCGIINDNMQRLAVQLVCGGLVHLCSNLQIRGDAMVMNKKHMASFAVALQSFFCAAVEQIRMRQDKVLSDIKRMQATPIGEPKAKEVIYNLCAEHRLPVSFLRSIDRDYFQREHRIELPEVAEHYGSQWGLYNAITRQTREMNLSRQIHYGHIIDVEFSRLKKVELN